MIGRRRRALRALLPLCLAACESPTEPSGSIPDVRSRVVGEAAQRLDRHGHFILPPPAAPDTLPITSAATAVDLAETFLHMFTAPSTVSIGPFSIREELERQRGAPIAFTSLVAGERTYFAESPYEPIPHAVPPYLRKYLGPFFLIPLLDRKDPAVVMTSSAYNTDVAAVDGRLVFPPDYGHDFSWAGIPVDVGYLWPITPEHAVEIVWRATRTRVNRVPHLIGPSRLFSPHYARWRVSLEHPVRVRGLENGRDYETSELFVSGTILHAERGAPRLREQIEVALPEQPLADTVRYRCAGASDDQCLLVVNLRPGFPVRFEPAVVP